MIKIFVGDPKGDTATQLKERYLMVSADSRRPIDAVAYVDKICQKHGKHPERTTLIFTELDHVFNQFRLNVGRGVVSSENIQVIFEDENGVVHDLELLPSGRLASWPAGFLELIDTQLSGLVGLISKENRND